MEKITRFIECLIPVTACNLKCEYCYIMQEERRTNKMPHMKYTAKQIGEALTKERLGGTCYFSICGAGETLIPEETVEIVEELLKQGHYVNITTNGTLSKRFDDLTKISSDLLGHLHFAFSLHYLELKTRDMLECFVRNVTLMKNVGCSFLIQVNMYDGYIPYLDEINRFCIDEFGAKPQLAATRLEHGEEIKLHTNLSYEEYVKIGEAMESPLFDFTLKNFNVRRREFCYAGDWSFILDLDTGIMRKCYNIAFGVNIFENPEKPIKFQAVGKGCNKPFCVNSSHFMSLGVIPELQTPTYVGLRDRGVGWYSDDMKEFLSQKLGDIHKRYSLYEKIWVTICNQIRRKRLAIKRMFKI